jgi:transcriptional regulator with GAF, ATPase, and Fis domain
VTDNRARDVTQAFVDIANTLVDGTDVVDLLTGLTTDCAQLLDIESAGLLLADGHGTLHVVAASSERTRTLELFQLQREEGPCLDSYRSGSPVSIANLHAESHRWPQFVAAATAAGFASVHAVPMRLRETRLGTLGLFGTRAGALNDEDLRLGQALAHVASIALVADKAAADAATINHQLQTALTSRVAIEQAKGLLSQLGDLDMDDAFAAIRRFARDHNRRLTDVAEALVSRSLPVAQVLHHATSAGVIHNPSN